MKRQKPANFRADVGVVLEGERGESAYEIAVRMGFVGTEQEWMDSLKGESTKAEQYAKEAMAYRDSSKGYATQSGNYAVDAKSYRDETQRLKESIYPEAESALTRIIAAKSEVEAIENQTRQYAENAHESQIQADADAREVRYLHKDTIVQKNVATDAAERARKYGEGKYWGLYYTKEETDAQISSAKNAEETRAVSAETQISNNLSNLSNTVSENYSTLFNKINADLQNYYRKAETYNKEEVDNMVSTIPKFSIKPVDELPTEDISMTTVYLLKTIDEGEELYTEYIYVYDEDDDTYEWVQLGKQKIDLSSYVTKAALFTVSASRPTDTTCWIKPL